MNKREVDRTPSAPPPFPREVMCNACLPSTTCCTPSTTSQCRFLSQIESLLQCRNHMAGLFSTHLLHCAQDRTGSCERVTMRGQRIMLQAPGANADRLRECLSPFKTGNLHFKGCNCVSWAYGPTQSVARGWNRTRVLAREGGLGLCGF